MPPAKLKATAVVAKAPPTAMIQPGRASERRRAEGGGRRAAEGAPRSQRSGAAGLAFEPAESVVFPDQRPDRVVAGAGDPGAVRRRGEPDEDRPGEGDGEEGGSRDRELADRDEAAAQSDPEPGERHAGDDHQRGAHL